MLAKVYSASVYGFSSELIEVECDSTKSLPAIVIVGLASKSVDEAKDRVRSAIKNSGLSLPAKKFTINLAPANLPKSGTGFDLAIAIGLLISSGQVAQSAIKKIAFCSELALDGSLRPVHGILSHVKRLHQAGYSIVVSPHNLAEAQLIDGATIYAPKTLKQLYRALIGEEAFFMSPKASYNPQTKRYQLIDMGEISQQQQAKRALEIAAAGGHNVLMNGPPGSGKTMLARAFAGILPEMNKQEIVEATMVHSMSAQNNFSVINERPFRSPHHTASTISLIGGGSDPKPGEVSLSNHGVLFLDELPEFSRSVVESLRQPLEDGHVTVSRAKGTTQFPAKFTLIATKNPCPCGYLTDPEIACSCSAAQIERYKNRLSGPLLDRFDIMLEVGRIPSKTILNNSSNKESEQIQKKVHKARQRQSKRFKNLAKLNSHMSNKDLKNIITISNEARGFLDTAADKLKLSARSYMRTIKVSQTIADLDNSDVINKNHVAEALQYRLKDLNE